MSRRQALETAFEYSMDILCVAPNANPPVCKILDYGKYRFQAQKKAKEAKKKQHIIEIKEVQLTPQIGENDLKIKAKRANEFLLEGNKVKTVVRFRGRQLAHQEVGVEVLNKFISYVEENANVEKAPVLEGRNLTVILGPKKKQEDVFMPKMKSKRALMKRIRVTGSGKIKRDCAYRRHLAPNKTHKQKRHLRKAVLLSNTDYKRVKFLISK